MKRLRSLLGAGRRTFKATPQEVAALHRVLDGGDPRYRKLVEQLETAPSVTRDHPSPDALVVNPSSTFDDLLFPLEVTEIASDWVRIRDARSGRDLKFRARVVRSGFLKDLEGITADGGPWPADWE